MITITTTIQTRGSTTISSMVMSHHRVFNVIMARVDCFRTLMIVKSFGIVIMVMYFFKTVDPALHSMTISKCVVIQLIVVAVRKIEKV